MVSWNGDVVIGAANVCLQAKMAACLPNDCVTITAKNFGQIVT